MSRYRRTLSAFTLAVLVGAAPAFAQSSEPPLNSGGGQAWASLGFQGDLAGSLNSSGVGLVNGQRAEINRNTWSERYDAALIFRFGGAYNIDGHQQVFGALGWEQSEADTATVGLIGGLPLDAKFRDYQGWGFDVGYRFFFNTPYVSARPFVGASVGWQHVKPIDANFSSVNGVVANDVPIYDDSWVPMLRVGGGIQWDINKHWGIQATLDIKYTGPLNDISGLGTLGFDRINDTGNRVTLPLMGGAFVKF